MRSFASDNNSSVHPVSYTHLRDLPGENKAGFSAGQGISELPLETCETMNGMWGYRIEAQNYKSPKELIHDLVKAAGKNANLLMNIGPQPNGELPATAIEHLKQVGKMCIRDSSQDVRIFLTKTTNLMFHQLNFIRLRQDSPVYLTALTPHCGSFIMPNRNDS